MKIFSLLRRGEMHPVQCEDYLVSHLLKGGMFVGAVMDGCSSAKESFFASALMGKILNKIMKEMEFTWEMYYRQGLKILAKRLLEELWLEMKHLKSHLHLEEREMLATLILLLYHQTDAEALFTVIGDGYLNINGEIKEIDQNNQPDYMAYYLEENFEKWFENQPQFFEIHKPHTLGISSDGIGTFRTLKEYHPPDFDPTHFIFVDNELQEVPGMLLRKFNILQNSYGYKPADDISIIKLIIQ